jgi:hypothetical protein
MLHCRDSFGVGVGIGVDIGISILNPDSDPDIISNHAVLPMTLNLNFKYFWLGFTLQLLHHLDHLDGRHGSIKSLVTRLKAGAIHSLLHGVAGQDAIDHRNTRFQPDFSQGFRDRGRKIFKMRRFAPQQGSQAHHRIILLGQRQFLSDQRNFGTSGNPHYDDIIQGSAMVLQSIKRTGKQPVTDQRVEPAVWEKSLPTLFSYGNAL